MKTLPPGVYRSLLLVAVLCCCSTHAQSPAGTALSFNGTNAQARSSFPDNVPISYPFTLTAWVKTAEVSPSAKGIAGEYLDGSLNGCSLHLINGRARAFYFRSPTSYVWDGALGLDGGVVADDQWHHLALVVDNAGGRLYVDTVLQASRVWTGTPGAPTTSEDFRVGNYSGLTTSYLTGQVDQVSTWNIALSSLEIARRFRLAFSGQESGLVTSWAFNEGSGDYAASDAGYSYLGLNEDVAWVNSTAPIGPAPIAKTLGPAAVSGGNATLRGELNARGVASFAFFEWGTTTAYGQTTPVQGAGSGTNTTLFTATVSGLVPNTTYHFRLVVTNEFGRLEGADLFFNSSTPFSIYDEMDEVSVLGRPAWGDFDNDGDLDLLIVRPDISSGFQSTGVSILRNDNGSFTGLPVSTNGQIGVGFAPGWVDFDRDGDLDIFVPGFEVGTRIYRNDGGVFTPLDVGLPKLYYGAAAWGDYDNDGDLDLLLYDGLLLRLFQNNGGLFTDIKAPFPFVANTSRQALDWGDFDNDGDLDLVTTGGENGGGSYVGKSHIWRNFFGALTDTGVMVPGVQLGVGAWADYNRDGNLDLFLSGDLVTALRQNVGGQFPAASATFPALDISSADWGDYDNDGDPDLLLGGQDGTAAWQMKLYRNNGVSFVDVGAALPGYLYPSVACGDFDGDGALDFAMASGASEDYAGPLLIYHNNSVSNTPPSSPSGLLTVVQGTRVDFRWAAASDATTPAVGLTYNLRVGTTPGGEDVLTANSDPTTGRRRLTGMGNAQFGTNHFLNLAPGTYYWSVQAVDAGYAASSFAAEASFTIAPPPGDDCGSGNALHFDGLNDYLKATNAAALNAFPITVTAWVKTLRNTNLVDGIVNKYHDSSGNGYSILLFNGTVYAFYARPGANQVFAAPLGINGGFIANGLWHHIAFTISPTGGQLFVDGNLINSLAWTGTAGVTTTAEPLQIGRYYTYANTFQGEIDEVTIWNSALSIAEINELLRRRVSGLEAGLLAQWSFNEDSGVVALDNTGHGQNGELIGGLDRVISTAPICAPLVRTFAASFGYWANAVPAWAIVNPQGSETTEWFEYGLTSAYGKMTTPVSAGSAVTSLVLSNALRDLTPNTDYHFRAVATNRFGRANGSDAISRTLSLLDHEIIGPSQPLETVRLAFAEMTGDGLLDFIESGRDNSGFPHTIGHSGNYDAPSRLTAWYLDGVSRGALAAGDFDNDGDVDLFLSGQDTNGTPQSLLWQNLITASHSWTLTNAPHAIPGMFDSAAAWGDFDNDGDLDIAVSGEGSGVVRYCRIYRNDHGALTNVVAVLPGVTRGSLAWGDYDGDGDLDLLVTGSTTGTAAGGIANIYRNDNGIFVDEGAGLSGVYLSSAAWADFDNDGDLDLAVGGREPSFAFSTRIYRNNGGGSFTDISAVLPGMSSGALVWGDYDNDGLLDLLLTGSPDGSDGAAFTRIYRHTLAAGSHVFTDALAGLPGMIESDVAWGDYDRSGTLDVATAGRNLGSPRTDLWRNYSIPNARPGAPAALSATVGTNTVVLSWNGAQDAETPAAALTYNLRVGITPGGSEVMSAHATATNGFRRVVGMGNAQLGTNAWLRLAPGTYYWTVQAVDGAFAGSPFAPEQSFIVPLPCGFRAVLTDFARPSTGQFLLHFNGCAGVTYKIEVSADLTNWSETGTATETSTGTFEFLDTTATNSPRFYRVRQL